MQAHSDPNHFTRTAAPCLLIASLALVASTQLLQAEETGIWSVEAEVEIGVESKVDAEDAEDEINDLFLSVDVEAEAELTDRLSFFTSLTLESVTDAEEDRAFEDLGLYVGEIGLSFDLDPVVLSIGKISPAFGSAWDAAPGYFGGEIADDYELEEMLGLLAEVELGDGTLFMSAFYPDDTRLSDSWGTSRGRNDSSEGDVGNTGKLNNFSLQYEHEWEETTFLLGARHFSQGEEDNDENAVILGVSHTFDDTVYLIGEVAHFNGWEGSDEDATIATLGAQHRQGPLSYSISYSARDISGAPTDRQLSIGVDYEFDSGAVLSAGLARLREEEEDSTLFGLSVTFPFEY